MLLAVEQLIGRELVWEVLNLMRSARGLYGRGDYLAPEEKQVLNQVDPSGTESALLTSAPRLSGTTRWMICKTADISD